MMWKKGEDTTSGLFTKKLYVASFGKHGSWFYGKDQYYEGKTKSVGQETNQDGIVGSARTPNGLEGAKHAAAAANIAVPIILSLQYNDLSQRIYSSGNCWHW